MGTARIRTTALLVLTIICVVGGLLIATGVIPTRGISALNVMLPLGAILFGFCVLSRCLEQESDRFAAEQESTIHATAKSGEQTPSATRRH